MKKVVFFVESMHCGGAERSLLSLLHNLDFHRYSIDVLVINKGGGFEKFIPPYINFKALALKVSFFSRVHFFINSKLNRKTHKAQIFWKSVEPSIGNYKDTYDVAIAWGQGFATYFVAQKIKSRMKYAWVNTDYNKAGYNFKLDKESYTKFDRIVGVSEFVISTMDRFIPQSKLVHINNIVDKDDILGRANEPIMEMDNSLNLTLVSVGRLVKPKAFELAIRSAKRLFEMQIDFTWYIIGEGVERPYLESLIEETGLIGKIILLGFRDNPYPYIKKCDIYVQTSSFEGLGRTLIEAAILCKPIVSTSFPTAFKLIEQNRTGFVTEMHETKIAEKIALLHSDRALYSQMVERLASKSNYDKEKTLERVYNLLDASP